SSIGQSRRRTRESRAKTRVHPPRSGPYPETWKLFTPPVIGRTSAVPGRRAAVVVRWPGAGRRGVVSRRVTARQRGGRRRSSRLPRVRLLRVRLLRGRVP